MKTPHEFLIDKGNKSIKEQINVLTVEELIKEYTLLVLKNIFENGLGNIDENCSKDELIMDYLYIKNNI